MGFCKPWDMYVALWRPEADINLLHKISPPTTHPPLCVLSDYKEDRTCSSPKLSGNETGGVFIRLNMQVDLNPFFTMAKNRNWKIPQAQKLCSIEGAAMTSFTALSENSACTRWGAGREAKWRAQSITGIFPPSTLCFILSCQHPPVQSSLWSAKHKSKKIH